MTDQQDLRARLLPVPQAFFDEFGNSADDRVWDYARACVEAAAKLGRVESAELSKEDVEASEEAYREAIIGLKMKPPEWSSLAPMWHALRTFISRKPQLPAGAPNGWVLVPREPTPEMLRAGFLSESEGFDIETPADAPGLVYRAMLAAAPQLPAGVPDDFYLKILVAAGHITQEVADQARDIAQSVLAAAPQPDNKESAPVAGSVDDAVLRFVAEIMKYWSEGDLDGGYRQELAVKHGILVPVEVTESCGEYCSCAEYGGFPQTCYRPSPILKAANAALQATRRSDGEKG